MTELFLDALSMAGSIGGCVFLILGMLRMRRGTAAAADEGVRFYALAIAASVTVLLANLVQIPYDGWSGPAITAITAFITCLTYRYGKATAASRRAVELAGIRRIAREHNLPMPGGDW